MKKTKIKRFLAISLSIVFVLINCTTAYEGNILQKNNNIKDLNFIDYNINNKDFRNTINKIFLSKYHSSENKNIFLKEDNILNRINNQYRKNFDGIIDFFDFDFNPEWDIFVPDDYSTIQSAINAAETGNRIFVRSGVYNENLFIDTDLISIHGEDKNDTIINGKQSKYVVFINHSANGINLSGFTIKGSKDNFPGILILSDYNIIQNNFIEDNFCGLEFNESSGNQILKNNISTNLIGVKISNHSHANSASTNYFSSNARVAISIDKYCSGNKLCNNVIEENGMGIFISNFSNSNTITSNYLKRGSVGIKCLNFSNGNNFYHNNFIDNIVNAFDSSENNWDYSEEGNYWDDYEGYDNNNDGIGDVPYNISGGANKDNYPLINIYLKKSIDALYSYIKPLKNESTYPPSPNNLANTYYVPDDYPTIQEAIDISNSGDTIIVRSGIYKENLVIDKPIYLIGEDKSNTIIDGQAKWNHVVRVKADYVEITGFTISASSEAFAGIKLFGNSTYIHDNTIQYTGAGIELWNCKNIQIENNNLYQNIWGIYSHFSNNIIVTNNNIEKNIYGIQLGFSSCEILKNEIKDNSLTGILLISSNFCVIEENRIYQDDLFINGNNGIRLFSSNHNEILENWVFNHFLYSVALYKSEDNTLSLNIIQGLSFNNFFGISLFIGSDGNNIIENSIEELKYGIYLRASDKNLIRDNNLTGRDFNRGSSIGVYLHILSNSNEIFNNSIYKYDMNFVIEYSGNNSIKNNNLIGPTYLKNEYGMYIKISNSNDISDNHIAFNKYGIYILNSVNNSVYHNILSYNKNNAIYVKSSMNCSIINNYIGKNVDDGISIFDSMYIDVIGNLIIDNNGVGLWISTSFLCIISENNFIGNNINSNWDTCPIVNFNGNFWDDYRGNGLYTITGGTALDLKTSLYLFGLIPIAVILSSLVSYLLGIPILKIFSIPIKIFNLFLVSTGSLLLLASFLKPKFDFKPADGLIPHGFDMPAPTLDYSILCDWVSGYDDHGVAKTKFEVGDEIYSYSELNGVIKGCKLQWDWLCNNITVYSTELILSYNGKIAAWSSWLPEDPGVYEINIYYNTEYIGCSPKFTIE